MGIVTASSAHSTAIARHPALTARTALTALTVLSLQLLCAGAASAEPVRQRTPIDVSDAQLGSVVFGQLLIPEDILSEESGELKDKHVKVFNDELRRLGYRVPETVSSVFKADELPDTDFLLGGSMTAFDCAREQGTTCGLQIDWELLHRDRDEVVYRVSVSHEEMKLKGMTREERARGILLGGLHALLARQKFVDALGAGERAATAEAELEPVVLARCTRGRLSLPKGARAAIGATALIRSGDSLGSAVFISPDGYLLTAAHVATRDNLTVRLRNAEELPAEVVRISTRQDVALLRLKDRSRRTACLVVSDQTPEVGEDIFAVGAPGGEELSFSISRGIVSGSRSFGGSRYLQTDAALNPGNSGGPMLGERGEVQAIASWKVGGAAVEGLGFGVPGTTALRVLGLSFGARSEAITADVQRARPGDSAVTDSADPAWFYVGEGAPGRTPGWVRPVRGWGYAAFYVGLSLLAIDLATSQLEDTSYDAGSAVNQLGWSVGLIGVGMVTSTYLLHSAPKPPAAADGEHAALRLSGAVGLGSVSLRGTF